MKKRKIIVLLSSIFFGLVIVASGCTQTVTPQQTTKAPAATQPATVVTVTPTQTPQVVTKDKTYNVLNPEGLFVPVQTSALAPRLDTIEGKTIYIWQGESDPVIGPALYPLMQKLYPKTDWKYVGVSGTGLSAPEDEVLGKVAGKKKADGVARLNGW